MNIKLLSFVLSLSLFYSVLSKNQLHITFIGAKGIIDNKAYTWSKNVFADIVNDSCYDSFTTLGFLPSKRTDVTYNSNGYINLKKITVSPSNITGEDYLYARGVVGLSDKKEKAALEIYPNPVKDRLSLNLTKSATINIYNHLGNFVMKTKNTKEIAIDHLESGVYFYQIQTENETYAGKFIKE